MVSGLQKIYAFVAYEIDNAMFLRQPPRPTAGRKVLERFGLADPLEGIAQDSLNQIEGADG